MKPDDIKTVLRAYLEECKKQGKRHTEPQINFTLADYLYKNDSSLPTQEHRLHKFAALLAEMVDEFAQSNVNLAFLHCFNKTSKAGLGDDLEARSIAAANLVIGLNRDYKFVVGLQSAGNEDGHDVTKLEKAYNMVKDTGLETGAHAGEGRGGDHVGEVLNLLKLSNLGHGFRALESLEALGLLAESQLVLNQCPLVNKALGSKIKVDSDGKPQVDGEKKLIGAVFNHPFFPMLREHNIAVNLCSDNPGFFGTLEDEILAMAGITVDFSGQSVAPLTLEELLITNLQGVSASAMPQEQKLAYARDVANFVAGYRRAFEQPIRIEHPLLAMALKERYRLSVFSMGSFWNANSAKGRH